MCHWSISLIYMTAWGMSSRQRCQVSTFTDREKRTIDSAYGAFCPLVLCSCAHLVFEHSLDQAMHIKATQDVKTQKCSCKVQPLFIWRSVCYLKALARLKMGIFLFIFSLFILYCFLFLLSFSLFFWFYLFSFCVLTWVSG
jgi:hypothetical protein